MRNKRLNELQKYVVKWTLKSKDGEVIAYQYFQTQKEAKLWAREKPGRKDLFKINYDFITEVE